MLQFLVDILPLGSGSVDPHIFADPDPGSKNLADPTDPDPKHCFNLIIYLVPIHFPSMSLVPIVRLYRFSTNHSKPEIKFYEERLND